jgi:ABC-type methionine transport system ATPase subunit
MGVPDHGQCTCVYVEDGRVVSKLSISQIASLPKHSTKHFYSRDRDSKNKTKQNKSESETASDIVATLLIRVEQCLQNPKFGFLPRILYTKPKYLLDTQSFNIINFPYTHSQKFHSFHFNREVI